MIDKTNGSLLLTFSRGDRGVINCFVMSDSDFTIDWFLDGWPIRDALFTTEFQVYCGTSDSNLCRTFNIPSSFVCLRSWLTSARP